jgi:3',5'-nucleoside bisphosphate phosphatase
LLTPAAVVSKAAKAGFAAIAITDHDTLAGLDEALSAAQQHGIELIPGLELSTLVGDREIHLLGYFPDLHSAKLNETLAKIVESRYNRAAGMVEKLNRLGLNISFKRVKEIAGTEFIGRPHIARALLEKGYIKQISEAFTTAYIGRGGKAYVERFRLLPAEGITLLLEAGAVPVLAHPGYLSQGAPMDEAEIKALVNAGLHGIEVFYSQHSPQQVQLYLSIAKKHNLLITGGSDCHGQEGVPNHIGSINLSYKYVQALKDKSGRV